MSTVLLVDDEVHILRAAEFKLKLAGIEVLCAMDGEQAWEIIEQETPDLVVTDLQMPRLNGLELIQRMRDSTSAAEIPVIMLTAKGYELTFSEEGNELQISAVVSKPFSPRELCRLVVDHLPADPAPVPGDSYVTEA